MGHIYLTFLQQVLGELLEHASGMFQAAIDRPRRPDCMASTTAGFNATRFFFLWGHMKYLVYQTPVDSVEDLLALVL